MIECEVCFESYQEGHLELHWETCVLRLVFRCSICNEDYVNREGLWNHLDLHEIEDDSKELNYQEVKARYKVHQCALCNDLRGYSESSYRMHVHNFHNNCVAQNRTIVSDSNILANKVASFDGSYPNHAEGAVTTVDINSTTLAPSEYIELETSDEEDKLQEQVYQIPDEYPRILSVTSLHPHGNKSNDDEVSAENDIEVDVVDERQTTTKFRRLSRKGYGPPVVNRAGDLVWPCPICKLTFEKKWRRKYHITVSHTEPKHKCPFCQKLFHLLSTLRVHMKSCCEMRCHECDIVFTTRIKLNEHNSTKHSRKGKWENIKTSNAQDLEEASKAENQHEHTAGDKAYSCTKCGKEYTSTYYMQYHKSVCHADPRHKCSFCQKVFDVPYKLRKHEKFCSAMRCHKCGIMFCSRARLDDHNFSKHSHNKPVNNGTEGLDNTIEIEETDLEDEDEGGSFATTSIHPKHILQTHAHIANINAKIRFWIAEKNIRMPIPHPEICFNEQNKATAKCWFCSLPVVLHGKINKDGSVYWFIANFTRHILRHMQSSQNPTVVSKASTRF